MCDDDILDGMERARKAAAADLDRRKFTSLMAAAGLLALLPGAACSPSEPTPPATPGPAPSGAGPTPTAGTVTESEVTITTPAGACDAYFAHPATGAHAAVLVWPDIFGLRDAFRQMGKRLASSGYAVLVVNPFYRKQKAPTAPPHPDFNDPPTKAALMELMGSLSPETVAVDAPAFVAWLDAQAAVDKSKKIATTGYCMGGPLVFRTAAAQPARIGAIATFHGGGLVTDKPDSPHLLIPQMKLGQALIAIAANDDEKDPKAKDTLKAAFEQAKVPAEIEVYAGAQHGWCPPDSHVYNHEAAEKAWARQLAELQKALA